MVIIRECSEPKKSRPSGEAIQNERAPLVKTETTSVTKHV